MDLGLRQSDVADRIGVGTQTVNYWEKAHFDPEPQYVPEIIAFLGYDPFGPPAAGFPARLKAARIAAGLTRRQLGAQLRVHPGTVPVRILARRIEATLGLSPEAPSLDQRWRRT
jgi:DNA-binding XRE family transcriptional regulator